ncbi:hypothetical protein Tco_0208793, partial [Tanacetum coccineum]
MVVGEGVITPKSLKRHLIQETSQVASPKALYSASVELLETTVCFFDFHEIKQDPKKIQYPVSENFNKGFKMRSSGSLNELTESLCSIGDI